MMPIRLAHFSDPHFRAFSWDPQQFLSKRWLGNWNALLTRSWQYQGKAVSSLPSLCRTLGVDHVSLTGDLSSTGLESEFMQARAFVDQLEAAGMRVHLLPGNHDLYIPEAFPLFYRYFPSPDQAQTRVVVHPLSSTWWWVGLHCALPTEYWRAYGVFDSTHAQGLEEALSALPSTARVVLANHFPLFSSGRPTHDLQGAEHLQQCVLRHPEIRFYLHGHEHTPYVIDRRAEGFPLVLNSGSCAHTPEGLLYLLTLGETHHTVEKVAFKWQAKALEWTQETLDRVAEEPV